MIRQFFIVLLLFSIRGWCQGPTPEHDHIVFDDLQLNSKLSLRSNISKLEKFLGKPDSITLEDTWDCGNYLDEQTEVKVYHYKGSRFIASGGRALLHKINFQHCPFSFDIGSTHFTARTSPAEFNLVFPRHAIDEITRLGSGTIEIPLNRDDGTCRFIFSHHQLVEIELWWPIC